MIKNKMKIDPKETAKAIAKTCSEINKILDAFSVMKQYDWFNAKEFKSTGFDILVNDMCNKYKTDESHIRKIGGWKDADY